MVMTDINTGYDAGNDDRKADDRDVFEKTSYTPVPAAAPFFPDSVAFGPVERRHSGISPRFLSSLAGSRAFHSEFLTGARMMGLDTARKPLHPQQLLVADVLNAVGEDGLALHSTVGVCIPRRASKTTSIWATALGRCMEREDYMVAFTAQSGTKARDRFLKDLVTPLERKYAKGEGGFKVNRSQGHEHIIFDNGSRIDVLPPLPDSFRGDGFDMVIIDEGQTQGPEEADELKAAILPTFDTRPGAQLVVAGTAGKHRSGLLWDTLEDGRNGRAGTGIIEYAAADTLSEEDVANPEVWQMAHPGIGTLTTLERIALNFEAMRGKIWDFAAEYLGVWPVGGGGRFLNLERWASSAMGVDAATVRPPDHFALGFAIHPDGLSACIVAAWRDEAEEAHVLVLDHRMGTQWFSPKMLDLGRRYKVPIAHDTYGGPTNVQVDILQRQKAPRPRLAPQTMADVKTAAALIVKSLDDGHLKHYDQDVFNEAARLAVKRKVGNGWGLGRGSAEDDITPLEAAALALHVFDGLRKREAFVPLMAN